MNYQIRRMTREQMAIAVDWAAEEGWNPGLEDAECYFSADPNGFFIGFLGDEPISVISAVNYADAFGFVGFYMVKPEYRGQGYGIQIWNAGLEYLKGLNVALDGVVEQQDNYKKSGFKLAYRNIRYQGIGGGVCPDDAGVVDLTTLPFETVDAYDQAFFPAPRCEFTRAWISQSNGHALGILQQERLAAMGVIRQCRDGYKIGPLFADTPELAETLFLALRAKVSDRDAVFLDVPEVNAAAVALAEKYAMTKSFETARMYTGEVPDLPLERLFGVASFEIG